ncbi:hypothetical protein C6341_g13997 [Phytophthora cactorum]|nr:hypothetical protein C6341_g13997 [Phytophthora cactorum]
MSVGAEARKRAMKAKGSNSTVVGFALVVAAGFFSIPFVAHYTKGANLTAQEKPLNARRPGLGSVDGHVPWPTWRNMIKHSGKG